MTEHEARLHEAARMLIDVSKFLRPHLSTEYHQAFAIAELDWLTRKESNDIDVLDGRGPDDEITQIVREVAQQEGLA
jgi:hypothetical protein